MSASEIKGKLSELIRTPRLWIYIGIAALCVVLLISMRSPSEEKNAEADIKPVSEAEPVSETGYERELEIKLTDIISKIQGAGEVTVMVTSEGSEEKIYAEDRMESDGKDETETVIIGTKEALLKQTKRPEVKGVLVVCGGGDKPQVVEKIVNAVSTVLDIPSGKVYVTKSK